LSALWVANIPKQPLCTNPSSKDSQVRESKRLPTLQTTSQDILNYLYDGRCSKNPG
jgi:hypothetical protein